MTRRSAQPPAAGNDVRVPPVLPHVEITVNTEGELSITLDRKPFEVPSELSQLGRTAMGRVIDHITAHLDTPARIDVREADGSVYTDIVVPDTPTPATQTEPESVPSSSRLAINGAGFTPDEDVAIAVVIAHQNASTDGITRLRLPPALLETLPGSVVLVGHSTGTIPVNGGGE